MRREIDRFWKGHPSFLQMENFIFLDVLAEMESSL
jgi:hypothetical protein